MLSKAASGGHNRAKAGAGDKPLASIWREKLRIIVLFLVAMLGACATDPAVMVRGMDEATFRSELQRRFNYPPPQPAPARLPNASAGQIADAAYFTHFPEYDRSYSPRARAQAHRLAERLRADAGGLSREQFILRVSEIAALADNAHTQSMTLAPSVPSIPLRMYLFADGLRVLYANEDNADLIGAQIDRIEGRGIDDIYSAILRYQGGGTPARRRLMLSPMLETPALLEAAGIAQNKDSIVISGILLDGTPFERRLVAEQSVRPPLPFDTARLLFPHHVSNMRGLSTGELPISLQNSDATFWSAPFNDGLYVRLTENIDRRLETFVDGVLTQVRQKQPPFIIIDMRMNNGGDYTRTYGFARALPEAARGARIYVLTSPWTFSAAITTIAALKDQGGNQIIIVGEDVGDRLDFWSEVGMYTLPNTRVAVLYARARHVYNGPCRNLDTCYWLNYLYPVRVRTLHPDIVVPWTFAAYREGRDPALEAVRTRQARVRSNVDRR